MTRPLEPGFKYAPPNFRDNYILIRHVDFPELPDYDGGLPGVGLEYGKKVRIFVPCRTAEEFWAFGDWFKYCTERIT